MLTDVHFCSLLVDDSDSIAATPLSISEFHVLAGVASRTRRSARECATLKGTGSATFKSGAAPVPSQLLPKITMITATHTHEKRSYIKTVPPVVTAAMNSLSLRSLVQQLYSKNHQAIW